MEEKMKTLNKILLMAVSCLILSTLTTFAATKGVTITLGSEPTTLDPQLREDGGERAINDNIYETLMERTSRGHLRPGLAKGTPKLLNPQTWEVKLRSGIKFHNGEPLNADAVVYSIKRIIDPKFNSEQISFFNTIKDAQKVDDLTLKIMTNGPDPILLSRLYWLKIVPPKHSKNKKFLEMPVGTGPYKFVSWKRGQNIVLERNENYWGPTPTIEKATYLFIGEAGTRIAGLMAGETDLVTNLLPEFTEQVPQTVNILGLEHPIIILNADGGLTKDVRVRQALNYAVDKSALAESLFEGYAEIAQGQLLSPSFFGFNEDVGPYPYDPEKAKSLIKAAGASGKTIELIATAGRWLKDRELVESVGAYWDAVGVKTKVRIFEFTEYLNRLFDRKSRGDGIFVAASNELLDADKTFSAYYQSGGIGSSNTDQQLSDLINAARTETNESKRKVIYHKAVKRAHDQAYFVWLLNIEDIYGLSERIQWSGRVDAKILVSEMQFK
jgi:peptide/nickel transport system substrate-binding protein